MFNQTVYNSFLGLNLNKGLPTPAPDKPRPPPPPPRRTIVIGIKCMWNQKYFKTKLYDHRPLTLIFAKVAETLKMNRSSLSFSVDMQNNPTSLVGSEIPCNIGLKDGDIIYVSTAVAGLGAKRKTNAAGSKVAGLGAKTDAAGSKGDADKDDDGMDMEKGDPPENAREEEAAAALAEELRRTEALALAKLEKKREEEAAAALEQRRQHEEELRRIEAELRVAAQEKARLADEMRLQREAAAREKAQLEAAAQEKARLQREAAAREKAQLEAAAAREKACLAAELRQQQEAASREKARLESEIAAREQARVQAEAASEQARREVDAAARAERARIQQEAAAMKQRFDDEKLQNEQEAAAEEMLMNEFDELQSNEANEAALAAETDTDAIMGSDRQHLKRATPKGDEEKSNKKKNFNASERPKSSLMHALSNIVGTIPRMEKEQEKTEYLQGRSVVVDVSCIEELSADEFKEDDKAAEEFDEFKEDDKAAEELEFEEDGEEFKKDSPGLCLQADAPWTYTEAMPPNETTMPPKEATMPPNEAMPPPPNRPPKQLRHRVTAKEPPKKKSPVKTKTPTKKSQRKSIVKTVEEDDDDISSLASFSSLESVSSQTRSKQT